MTNNTESRSLIEIGRKGQAEAVVTPENTAKTVGSGSLEVFATPMLAALMESAAVHALKLPNDQTSVGTRLDIKHLAATPVGMKVRAEAEIIEVDGRSVVFTVDAFDEKEKIGEGRHERFIVNSNKFIAKANAKKG
ncbi:thioesterase family protein [Dehalobacter sp. DCM]|uniref:thioesterase family protein n=1 Tax=Dehalobacter sp. DCM TaxID=2907827 RepID=UPI003081FB79|nr:thioesterase family protein [Dehalobacter sp. DCM]